MRRPSWLRWPVSAEWADTLTAQNERLRDERDDAYKARDTAVFNRAQVLRQLAEADAANKRLAGRNLELAVRLSAYAESDPEYLAGLEKRLDRIRRATARYLTALWEARTRLAGVEDTEALKQRIKSLEKALDDAFSLDHPAVAAGATWQDRREQKMRFDA